MAAETLREGVRSGERFSDLSDRFLGGSQRLALDPLRVVIDTRHGVISGYEARRLLFERHQIHTEMATDSVIVAVIGTGAVPDIKRVLRALHLLPDQGAAAGPVITPPDPGPAVVSLRDAYFAPAELVPSGQAVGRVSADSPPPVRQAYPTSCQESGSPSQTLDFLQRTANSPSATSAAPRRSQVAAVARPEDHRLSC